MRVLVTGGLGFLGRAVALDLTASGHQVVALTRGQAGARPPVGVDVVEGDVRDRQRMSEVIAAGRYDALCHLAALTRARDSFADPLAYFDVNVGGTTNVLLALDAAGKDRPPARVVLASTNIVYGSGYEGALAEDLSPRPESPYAASKLAAEQVLTAYADTGAVGASILRCFNIAGAADGIGDTDTTRIIPNVFRAITGELPQVTLNGDGSAVRDFIHVLDVAVAVRLALAAANPGTHRVYNIGSGSGTSMADIVLAAEELTGTTVPVHQAPPKPEPQRLTADIGRARRELGWEPSRSDLRTILADAWAAWDRPVPG